MYNLVLYDFDNYLVPDIYTDYLNMQTDFLDIQTDGPNSWTDRLEK